ncbi:MAG: hypothetical protein F6K28_09680 [Microcoleus sp. SIO2G3]|nr:hypothetical protein [Microcoleus sp. SIO2G3]
MESRFTKISFHSLVVPYLHALSTEDEELRTFIDRFVYRPWVSYVKKLSSRRELSNTINGNANNTLNGGVGDDIFGFAAGDTLQGGDGNDWIVGGQGNDILTGGAW